MNTQKNAIEQERISQTITRYENAYQVTLGNSKGYALRLKELKDWDKPRHEWIDDNDSAWTIWTCKIIALENLISQ